MKRVFSIAVGALLFLCGLGGEVWAARWQKLSNCRLDLGRPRDGDTLPVVHGGQEYVFRLYFVEAAESNREASATLIDQATYWDIPDMRVIRVGREAAAFVEKILAPGFSVLTQWERASGPKDTTWYYAIVQVGEEDLAERLVEEGLARIHGASTPPPDGTSLETFTQRLRQAETRAKQRKVGAWAGAELSEPGAALSITPAADQAPPPPVQWPNVPTVAFLRAEAYVNTERFEEAETAMRALLRRFPEHVQRARIEFYLGLSLAMQERFEEAVKIFRAWLTKYPQHLMASEVQYWLPISLFYGGEYAEARPLFEDFAEKNSMSVYAPEAAYRAALCRYAVEDFEEAAKALDAWVTANPEHYFRWEALVTLGDALAAIGELEPAKGAYLRVGKAAGAFQYMALTQCAKVFKALGTPDDLKDMAEAFAAYIRENPDSDNIIDAAYQAGWALRQIRRLDEARRLYWTMIELHGNTVAWDGFDLMLNDLAGMYGDEPGGFPAVVQEKKQKAMADKRMTLAARLNMADIQVRPPADQPRAALVLASSFRNDQLGLETLAWLGDMLIPQGKTNEAAACFEQLLKTGPESRHAARAHVRLAEQQVKAGKYAEALLHADAALANPAEPTLVMEATFLRARSLQATERYSEAIADYSVVLANRSTPRTLKPEALLNIAACLEAQDRPRQALPYYQRVYVLYGAYAPAVARAYMGSGKAFEKIKDYESAARTYREMLELETMTGTPEAVEARQRLTNLGS
ncbi:MAG: tetratricopeptide repeat protein [Verrucomicrobia bacterium]|nr:tetratricopeptide repeat protein [Verrucomicrobiota bacterium]